jgi:hypothetical protein
MIKAVNKKGGETQFSEVDWKTGLPQRYGWMEKGLEALKTLPKEIVDFVKPPKKIEVKDEPVIQIVKENKKKNDNTKQKVGTAGKRQPKRVGKAK